MPGKAPASSWTARSTSEVPPGTLNSTKLTFPLTPSKSCNSDSGMNTWSSSEAPVESTPEMRSGSSPLSASAAEPA